MNRPLLGEPHARHLLQQALAASTADATEVLLTTSAEALTRFAHNAIHQNVAEQDAELEVRAALGLRVGSASTNDLSSAGIERAAQLACDLARHSPENPAWPGLPEPQTLPALVTYDEAVAALSPEARAHRVADLCRAAQAHRLWASGAFSTGQAETAVLNSNGHWAYTVSTDVDLTFVLEHPSTSASAQASTSAYAHATGWQLNQIDWEALSVKAIRQASGTQAPQSLPTGSYPVVLEPYAVLTLLEALVDDGMGALAVQEERSWMNPHLGQPCLSPLISIVDDAFDPLGRPTPFDCEGMPKQQVPIVVQGVPTSPVYDRLTAAREPGRASTGHAQPYLDEDWDGPLPENLSLAPGANSVDNMVQALDTGVYVSRFWYVRPTGTPNVGVTGTTRDGVWWIERGELAYPLVNMRFDQDLLTALRQVRAVSQERATLSGLYGTHRVPALALDQFHFIAIGERP